MQENGRRAKLLLEQDIIERAEGPTPWVSPIETPLKPKDPTKLLICVDTRRANEAIQRERHVTQTLDDLARFKPHYGLFEARLKQRAPSTGDTPE